MLIAYAKVMEKNKGIASFVLAVLFVLSFDMTVHAIPADPFDKLSVVEFCAEFLKSAFSFSPRNVRERASDAIAMSASSYSRIIASTMERRVLGLSENGHAGDGEYIGSILFGKKPCAGIDRSKNGARVTMRASEYVIRPGSGNAYETPVTFVIDIVDVDGEYKVSGCVRKVSGRRVVHTFRPVEDPNGKKMAKSTESRIRSSIP